MLVGGEIMVERLCKTCQYFLQHYTFNERKIFRVNCGHCTFARATKKQPNSKACKHYVLGCSQEDAFVSKEFLSRELLKYVLNLDLLPRIDDEE